MLKGLVFCKGYRSFCPPRAPLSSRVDTLGGPVHAQQMVKVHVPNTGPLGVLALELRGAGSGT